MERAYLIAGSGGMLGTALRSKITETLIAPPERELDITDEFAIAAHVEDFASSLGSDVEGVFINAAAYTNVERAEDDSERAMLVNGWAPGELARAAASAGVRFVHVSTDFVFDGSKEGPYTEEDEPNPLSVYGITKLAGEHAALEFMPSALIVRTAWVFGPNGANFPNKVVAAAKDKGCLSVVTDEIGSPTYTMDLAAGIIGLVEAGAAGRYHLAGSGSCSRYELACETLRLAGLDSVPVEPVSSKDFETKAPRPRNSVLDCSKAARLGVTMPDWHDALARFLGV